MNEVNPQVKYTFSRIGIIYSIFSVVATVLQILILNVIQLFSKDMLSVDMQIIISSSTLYVIGLLVLGIGLSGDKLKFGMIEKHTMKPLAILKAFCMCYTLLIASNLIGTVITTVIGIAKGSPIENPVENLALETSIPVLFIFTVICAPIFEELFFRKFLVDRTIQYGEVPCMLVSGLMFGLFHGNLSQFPYAFTIGAFFAYIYIRTGRIVYPIILHAIVNFMGSIAGVIVLKAVDYDALMQISITGSEEEMLNGLLAMFTDKGFLILMIYEVIVITIVIVGLVLWILHFRKFRFEVREEELPKGNRFATVLGNPGMIAFSAIWLIMIILNTFL